MPRKLRVQYAGAIYHVMNRGDRRETIFEDEQDHVRFLETLGEACQKTGWQVHAWCLMSNHEDCLLADPSPLSQGQKIIRAVPDSILSTVAMIGGWRASTLAAAFNLA